MLVGIRTSTSRGSGEALEIVVNDPFCTGVIAFYHVLVLRGMEHVCAI